MASEPLQSRPRRIRRLPADAEREILDAAEAALAERAFRDVSVEELMRRTGMTRSTFYHYFRSLEDVAVALLRRVQAEMMDAAQPWLDVADGEDPVPALRRCLRAVAGVFARHGRVLAAINEASFHHEAVESAWRHGVLADWIAAVATQLRRQREQGLTSVEEPGEVARALLLMNTAVLVERLGDDPPEHADAVAATLERIWVGTLYPEALAGGR